MKFLGGITLALFVFLNVGSVEAAPKDLKWMEGKWLSVDPRMPMESEYTYQADIDSIVGFSRIVVDGKTTFLELEFVTEKNGILFLTVMQPDHPPVSFAMSKQTETSVEYTNSENLFPRVIQYFLDDQHRLIGKIIGEIQGKPASQQFVLQKVQR